MRIIQLEDGLIDGYWQDWANMFKVQQSYISEHIKSIPNFGEQ